LGLDFSLRRRPAPGGNGACCNMIGDFLVTLTVATQYVLTSGSGFIGQGGSAPGLSRNEHEIGVTFRPQSLKSCVRVSALNHLAPSVDQNLRDLPVPVNAAPKCRLNLLAARARNASGQPVLPLIYGLHQVSHPFGPPRVAASLKKPNERSRTLFRPPAWSACQDLFVWHHIGFRSSNLVTTSSRPYFEALRAVVPVTL